MNNFYSPQNGAVEVHNKYNTKKTRHMYNLTKQ